MNLSKKVCLQQKLLHISQYHTKLKLNEHCSQRNNALTYFITIDVIISSSRHRTIMESTW